MENSYFQFLTKWGGDCAPGSDGPETVAVEFKQETSVCSAQKSSSGRLPSIVDSRMEWA